MTEESDALYLGHILAAIEQIKRYTQHGKAAFLCSDMIQDAVIRKLEVIGEAVKNLSNTFRDENPNVPWRAIAANRDRLIHGYFVVDPERVWRTVSDALPPLETALIEIRDATCRSAPPETNIDESNQ